jgi:hypothetical protein
MLSSSELSCRLSSLVWIVHVLPAMPPLQTGWKRDGRRAHLSFLFWCLRLRSVQFFAKTSCSLVLQIRSLLGDPSYTIAALSSSLDKLGFIIDNVLIHKGDELNRLAVHSLCLIAVMTGRYPPVRSRTRKARHEESCSSSGYLDCHVSNRARQLRSFDCRYRMIPDYQLSSHAT